MLPLPTSITLKLFRFSQLFCIHKLIFKIVVWTVRKMRRYYLIGVAT